MKKRTWLIALLVFLTISATAALVFFPQDDEITQEEVTAMLEARYQADIASVERREGIYAVDLVAGSGEYEVLVEAASGEVTSFQQVGSREDGEESQDDAEGPEYLEIEEVRAITAETVSEEAEILTVELEESAEGALYMVDFALQNQSGRLELDAVNGSIQLYTLEDEEPAEPMTEEEAVEIALSEFQGDVEDIDLEEENGRLVFEIEIENESSGREADIVIDAYTGEILSVELDD